MAADGEKQMPVDRLLAVGPIQESHTKSGRVSEVL
jgi:hypothetical protein